MIRYSVLSNYFKYLLEISKVCKLSLFLKKSWSNCIELCKPFGLEEGSNATQVGSGSSWLKKWVAHLGYAREWLILTQQGSGSSWLKKWVAHLGCAREWLILTQQGSGSSWLSKGVAHLGSTSVWLILAVQGSGSSWFNQCVAHLD